MRREYGFNKSISLNRFLLLHLPLINGATKLAINALNKLKISLGLNTNIQIQPKDSNEVEALEKVLREKVNIENINIPLNNAKSLKAYVQLPFDMGPYKYDLNMALYRYNEEMSFLAEKDLILLLNEFQTLKPKKYVDGTVIDAYMISKSIIE